MALTEDKLSHISDITLQLRLILFTNTVVRLINRLIVVLGLENLRNVVISQLMEEFSEIHRTVNSTTAYVSC